MTLWLQESPSFLRKQSPLGEGREGCQNLESATEHANSAAYANYYQVMVMSEGECVYSRFVRDETSNDLVLHD